MHLKAAMRPGLHWFRNDLRLRDNTALLALQSRVDAWLPLFVLDPRLFPGRRATRARERFLVDCLERLRADLERRGIGLCVRRGNPEQVIPRVAQEVGARVLSFNEDTSPFAGRRDAGVCRAVEAMGLEVVRRHDRTIFASDEVTRPDGGPYSVYTPYRNAWWRRFDEAPRAPVSRRRLKPGIAGVAGDALPAAEGESEVLLPTGGERAASRRLDRFIERGLERYAIERDFPAFDSTARLSAHLRFGAISVRECFERVRAASRAAPQLQAGASKWLDELVWREFYASLLMHHPHTTRENFRREYDTVQWNDDPEGFQAWCEGRTGFPIVDAGMRQLSATGWMHNRVRMITASFLTKDLLIDWRKGERFFFDRLVDGDPASNAGGWQWAASTGTDAQPYFRIFNPLKPGERWDRDCGYIRRWVPELRGVPTESIHRPDLIAFARGYPTPIVDHAARRRLAIDRFKAAKTSAVRRGAP